MKTILLTVFFFTSSMSFAETYQCMNTNRDLLVKVKVMNKTKNATITISEKSGNQKTRWNQLDTLKAKVKIISSTKTRQNILLKNKEEGLLATMQKTRKTSTLKISYKKYGKRHQELSGTTRLSCN